MEMEKWLQLLSQNFKNRRIVFLRSRIKLVIVGHDSNPRKLRNYRIEPVNTIVLPSSERV